MHKQKNNVPIESLENDDEPNFIIIFYILCKNKDEKFGSLLSSYFVGP